MRTDIETIKNDVGFDLDFTLRDFNGNAINLNAASSIKLRVQKKRANEIKFEGEMVVVDGPQGQIKYTVKAGDFDEVGKYYGEIRVVFEDGQTVTFDDILIKVKSDLPK
ncbi:MAG: BppU family phage baseplate upper protein [bacterium]